MKLTDEQAEKLRTLTVEVMLALRAEYLGSGHANPLKHWEILATRLRGAARTTATPEEWTTAMQRRLGLLSLSVPAAQALADLADQVRSWQAAREWLELLERESSYVMALTRLSAEQRKKQRAKPAQTTLDFIEPKEAGS